MLFSGFLSPQEFFAMLNKHEAGSSSQQAQQGVEALHPQRRGFNFRCPYCGKEFYELLAVDRHYHEHFQGNNNRTDEDQNNTFEAIMIRERDERRKALGVHLSLAPPAPSRSTPYRRLSLAPPAPPLRPSKNLHLSLAPPAPAPSPSPMEVKTSNKNKGKKLAVKPSPMKVKSSNKNKGKKLAVKPSPMEVKTSNKNKGKKLVKPSPMEVKTLNKDKGKKPVEHSLMDILMEALARQVRANELEALHHLNLYLKP